MVRRHPKNHASLLGEPRFVEQEFDEKSNPSLCFAHPLGTNSWRVFSSKRFANFDFSSNFEHSFTLQTWLRLASNFAKTRFRRSPTFHFSTSKKNRNFEQPVTPRGWLRSASNFAKTRFRRSPAFHFATAKTSAQILDGRLPPKDGSVRSQTLPKRVSDDPRHFIYPRRKTKKVFFLERKFRFSLFCTGF